MLRIENYCCDCAVPGYPCRGNACPNRHVEVHYCDNPRCGCELDEIYEADGLEYCEECYYELHPDDEAVETRFGNILDIMLGKSLKRRSEREPQAI